MCQGGFEQALTKVLQVLAKGFPIFYLLEVSLGGGICWTKKLKNWPEPKHPKMFPKVSGGPQAIPKNYKAYLLPPPPAL